MNKFIIIIALVLSNINMMFAQKEQTFVSKDKEGNSLVYKVISDNSVMLSGWKKNKKQRVSLIIPESVKYKGRIYIVNKIDPNCRDFILTDVIEKVILPNTITELPSAKYDSGNVQGLFRDCYGLREIVLPEKLKKIGPLAFESCWSLEEINIPESVTEIGGGCFYGCRSLKRVKLPSGIRTLSTTGDKGFFEYCKRLEEIDIPNSVESLGVNCFERCEQLKRIKIPSKILELPEKCFFGCDNLSEVVFPVTLNKIGRHCFTRSNFVIKGMRHNVVRYDNSFYSDYGRISDYYNSFEAYKSDAGYEVYQWQQKRDFETTAEYKARVTPENQQKKIQEYLAKAIKEYTDKNKIQVTLGQYDADTEIYTLNSNYGTKYVKVARAEAFAFKQNFSNATFDASYVMGEEYPQVADMSIFINGKSYRTEKTVIEKNNYDLAIDLPDINLDLNQSPRGGDVVKPITIDKTIDESIPTVLMNNSTTFAVIIGNERYTRVAHVPYANNDARIFAEYCKKTLGLPDKNVKLYENATYGTMIGAMSDIQKIAKAFKGDINVIFYYAGHGIPDEATGDGYLLPIDADGMKTEVCYPLSRLYKEFGSLGAKSVVAFMDACFSGTQRGSGMVVAARGVAIKAKSEHPTGNTIVFTAATDKQTAYPYEEKGHGMFTYYLLKKLRDTKGDCTLGELGSYICNEVAKQAIVTNGKEQTPVVLTSDGVVDDWKNFKMR